MPWQGLVPRSRRVAETPNRRRRCGPKACSNSTALRQRRRSRRFALFAPEPMLIGLCRVGGLGPSARIHSVTDLPHSSWGDRRNRREALKTGLKLGMGLAALAVVAASEFAPA